MIRSILGLMLLMSIGTVCQGQDGRQQYQPQPIGNPRYVPVQPMIPIQQYQVGPPVYQPMPQQRRRCYRQPRGVWGVWPFFWSYY